MLVSFGVIIDFEIRIFIQDESHFSNNFKTIRYIIEFNYFTKMQKLNKNSGSKYTSQ
jgi:hypothetical protein